MITARRPNRRALAVALAILLVPVTAGTVSAAYGKPTVALRAVVVYAPAWIDVFVNRTPKQVSSCSYVLDGGAPADCGWMLGSHISTRYILVPSDQSLGDHAVTVTVVLTDNEEISNSISFTITEPATDS